MNGTVRSTPDIHSQIGSASDAIIADANTRSRTVGGPGAHRFNAVITMANEAAIFTALPRLVEPGFGSLTSAYHRSLGFIAADSNCSAIRFDLTGLCRASSRWPS